MNKERQIELLTEYLDNLKKDLLANADQWPEEWDGIELRWLVEEAVNYHTRKGWKENKARHRSFVMHFLSNDLY